jgi:hypothetical protein
MTFSNASTNDRCMDMIRLYWADMGYQVSVKLKEHRVPDGKGGMINVIATDLVNGLPSGCSKDTVNEIRARLIYSPPIPPQMRRRDKARAKPVAEPS